MPTFPFTQAADADLTTKPKRLTAYNLSASAAAVVNLRDGGVAGPILVQIQAGVNVSVTEGYPHPGIVFPSGCFVDVVSGTFVGSVTLE